MTTSKQIFLNRKDLRDKLAEIVHSEWFSEALLFAKGELILNVTKEELDGVLKFEEILMTLCDDDPLPRTAISTGFKHDLEPVKSTDKKKE